MLGPAPAPGLGGGGASQRGYHGSFTLPGGAGTVQVCAADRAPPACACAASGARAAAAVWLANPRSPRCIAGALAHQNLACGVAHLSFCRSLLAAGPTWAGWAWAAAGTWARAATPLSSCARS